MLIINITDTLRVTADPCQFILEVGRTSKTKGTFYWTAEKFFTSFNALLSHLIRHKIWTSDTDGIPELITLLKKLDTRLKNIGACIELRKQNPTVVDESIYPL